MLVARGRSCDKSLAFRNMACLRQMQMRTPRMTRLTAD